MVQISKIHAREVLDSRGNPTVECELTSGSGFKASGIVPSGASTGTHEVLELRDKDPKRYHGKGVLKAVENVNTLIAEKLIDQEFTSQKDLDQLLLDLDGTANKQNLGANAILSVSLAFSRLLAHENNKPLYKSLETSSYKLPQPMCNVINGGKHADNTISFQEFMIVPLRDVSFTENIRACSEVFHELKKLLIANGQATGVGDEGGFAPNLASAEEALSYISQAITKAGYELGKEFGFSLDVAASEFHEDGVYKVYRDGEVKDMSAAELEDYYGELVDQFPIISIEDPFGEDDWAAWANMTAKMGDKIQIVGDDLLVTNPDRLKKSIAEKSCNAILIKPNQIGTVTETLETIKIAQDNGFGVVISHRSGETEDTFIADLAVATSAGQMKTGSLSRTDRVGKYNQLIRIEEELGA